QPAQHPHVQPLTIDEQRLRTVEERRDPHRHRIWRRGRRRRRWRTGCADDAGSQPEQAEKQRRKVSSHCARPETIIAEFEVACSPAIALRSSRPRGYAAAVMWRLAVLVGVVWMALAGCTEDAACQVLEPPLQSAARGLGSDQGVYAEAQDGSVLAAQAADRPVHPASVNKIASSLAVLQRLGPGHRFQTNVLADGPLLDGQLAGNLVVEGGGDPSLVYENAFLMLRRLRALGVRTVAGDVVVRGPFVFNWHPDPNGARFRLALSGRDGAPAWASLERLAPWNRPRRPVDAAISFR